jgi:hypothetical protein
MFVKLQSYYQQTPQRENMADNRKKGEKTIRSIAEK